MSINPQYLGKYALQERLGRGGMGEVWKAFDPQLRRYVAIKFLRTDLQNDSVFMTRFHREAQAIASLRHPNIIQIYDAHIPLPLGREDDRAYMVMDYVPGQTLADYIRSTSRASKFPPSVDIVRLFTPISLAIDYAHQNGLIHRDIKPANILLDARNTTSNPMGEPLLTDFGLVKPIGDATGALTHASLGTPLYVAPEQAQGHSGNEQSDIYSLGIILYEIFTGITPFQGNNSFDIMLHHVKTLPTPPSLINPTIPPALNAVILRCLAKDPAKRFSSASSMTAALAEALTLPVPENLGTPTYPTDTSDRPTPYVTAMPSNIEQPSPELRESLSLQSPPHETPPQHSSGTASPVLPLDAAPPSSKQRRDRQLGLIQRSLIVLLVIALVVSGLAVLFTFHPWNFAVPANQVAGHAFFVSSGQSDVLQPNSPGLNDELQIDLQNIPAPAANQAYYAWLIKDNEGGTILLGKLNANSGQIHFLYQDPQHTNLLAITNGLLITEENAHATPDHPSLSQQTYRALFSQVPNPADAHHFSVLDHLRHLLSGEQTLDKLGIHGGLDIWLLRDTARVSGWANIARDFWEGTNTNTSFLHGQLVHIVDVLDGQQVDPRDAPVARIALIDTPNQNPPDYLDHTINHLVAMSLAPGATQEQRQLAARIERSLTHVMSWLEQAHQDAQQLITMNTQQMTQPQALSLLDNMATAANNAYIGQIDPATSQIQQEGVAQLYTDIQRLATLNITVSPAQ